MLRSTFLIALYLCGYTLIAQSDDYNVSCVAFYNLENLFDTVDDTTHNDDEFTPLGANAYTEEVYADKLDHLSQVISEIGSEMTPHGPALLGVSEIEKAAVLRDLISHENLAERPYSIIHYESKDWRGIDVALLYQPRYFLPEISFTHSLITSQRDSVTRYSRDILFVVGQLLGERVIVSVNHWPSRRGGAQATAHLRNKAAMVNRRILDSLSVVYDTDKYILMGDLNDDPSNQSTAKYMRAVAQIKKMQDGDSYNPYWQYYKRGYGTTAWRDSWSLFDQIIVSQGLVNGDKRELQYYKAKVYSPKYLVQKSGNFKGYPYRSYAGGKYAGGYSDHFPVYMFLIRQAS